MNITKENKLAACKNTLTAFYKYKSEGNYGGFICSELRSKVSNPSYPVLVDFPEFNKYKPKRLFNQFMGIWFPRDLEGLNKRIEVLESVIKDLE